MIESSPKSFLNQRWFDSSATHQILASSIEPSDTSRHDCEIESTSFNAASDSNEYPLEM